MIDPKTLQPSKPISTATKKLLPAVPLILASNGQKNQAQNTNQRIKNNQKTIRSGIFTLLSGGLLERFPLEHISLWKKIWQEVLQRNAYFHPKSSRVP